MPPASSPLWLDADGAHLEVEIAFASTSVAVTPVLSRVGLLSSSRPE
jgi:hypothetical protein